MRHVPQLRRRLRRSEAVFILPAVVVGAAGGRLAALIGVIAHALQVPLHDPPPEMRLSGPVPGLVAEPHLRKRYADELERSRRAVFVEE